MVNTGFATVDLKGLEVETENNSVTIAGIYDMLDKFYNSYKPFLLTNYTSKRPGYPDQAQPGSPVIAQVTRPGWATFFIEFLGQTGIIIIRVTNDNKVMVFKVYGYHSQDTPTTNASMRSNENEIDDISEVK